MDDKSYTQIQERLNLNKDKIAQLPILKMAVLRNIMVEPIEPYLQYLGFQLGLNTTIHFGEYDNVYQETVGGQGGLLDDETDVILVFTRLETLSWALTRNFASLNQSAIEQEVERIQTFIDDVLSGIRRQTKGMILWHSFEIPVYPALGIFDYQSTVGQQAVIKSLNEYLRCRLAENTNAYLVDINTGLARLGAKQFYDMRYWYLGRAPYTREALGTIADEVFKFVRVTKGKNKKCLVLDCDNTLWGGIIGEDSLAGIRLSKTYPGSPYYEFQQEILNLHHRGVILALCSKNNEADVWEVFHNHPDMVLKQEHIAAAQINWNDKASNLRQIASDLNIGLDSLVFVDDSQFEVNLVQQSLPEVEVIHLPATKSVHYRDILASYGGFDTLTLTEEDKKRGAMYRAEVTRNKLRQEVTDLISYYQSLEMVAEINFADAFTIPRIAQLTQKTNQFNLTTRRYTEADVTAMVESPSVDIISLRLGDSFGDLGLVGVCILKYDETWAEIDTFLLSCRALGRMAEDLLLGHVLELVKVREFHLVKGTYLSTRKNAQVKDFYIKQGFTTIAETPERIMFEYDLSKYTGQFPGFFKEIKTNIFVPNKDQA